MVFQGLIVSILTLTAYLLGHYMEAGIFEIVDSPDGMTMAFLTLSMTEIFHSFNMRSRRSSLLQIKHQNLFLWGAMVLSLICTTMVIYVPFLAAAFEFEHISLAEYTAALALAFSIIPIVEITKWIQRKIER